MDALEVNVEDLPLGKELIARATGSPDELVREIVELDAEDLQILETSGPAHSQATVKHIRAIHHTIALRLAAGEKPIEITRALSVTGQTISKLQKDPQFIELVNSYRDRVVENTLDHIELMNLVGFEALSAIHERLTDEGARGEIPLDALRKLFTESVDRVGYSPVRRSETASRVTHELGRDTISRIKGLHSEDNLYQRSQIARNVTPDLEAEHKEDSEAVGAAASVVEIFQSSQRKEIKVLAPAETGISLPESGGETN